MKDWGWRAPKKKKGLAFSMSKNQIENLTITFNDGQQATLNDILATFITEGMLKVCLSEDEKLDEWTDIRWYNLTHIKEVKQWTEKRLTVSP